MIGNCILKVAVNEKNIINFLINNNYFKNNLKGEILVYGCVCQLGKHGYIFRDKKFIY